MSMKMLAKKVLTQVRFASTADALHAPVARNRSGSCSSSSTMLPEEGLRENLQRVEKSFISQDCVNFSNLRRQPRSLDTTLKQMRNKDPSCTSAEFPKIERVNADSGSIEEVYKAYSE